ncbi:hypothetical protein MXM82_08785 [Pseudomonas asiatica]|uniref:hypothetical protein n=1 Tax=Pseudomonas asiatica TaxID=2219225 RepID=UPI002DB95D92|nr:hypothetical protein [Pseudomonas asiatica]MEB6589227.1 hypothetical protein [Pseudomonas asiatica]
MLIQKLNGLIERTAKVKWRWSKPVSLLNLCISRPATSVLTDMQKYAEAKVANVVSEIADSLYNEARR